MELNLKNWKKRKVGALYHDYVEDFWNRSEPVDMDRSELWREATWVLVVLLVAAFVLGVFVGMGVAADRYVVSRVSSNLYEVNQGCSGCYFRTKYCYERAYQDEVVFDGSDLFFSSGESCPARLIR